MRQHSEKRKVVAYQNLEADESQEEEEAEKGQILMTEKEMTLWVQEVCMNMS